VNPGWRRVALLPALALAVMVAHRPVEAFPGILIGKDEAPRFVHATQVVLMRRGGVSVFTVMVDYEGPMTPFALVLPVPSDVRPERIETVRRGILLRLEQISAPRFHAFYEQDPCTSGAPAQDWEHHVEARGHGFLTPDGVPPEDEKYALSNLLTAPVAPVFKKVESEFRYHVLESASPAALGAWIHERSYRLSPAALAALTPHLGAGKSLLIAEVSTKHVEMTGQDRVQLGGIRYWTGKPALDLPVTLGLQNLRDEQDLSIYVLDRDSRFQVKNYPNVVPPTNVSVDPRASERLGGVYNALFERVADRTPLAFVTEFAWSTRGCGIPCPDAPLGLDELMTLGADVLETHTTSAAERAIAAPVLSEADRKRFEEQMALLPPARRKAARRDRARDLRELARRRSLAMRHTFVLSRLHRAYDAASLPRDIALEPAPPLAGGIGIPRGAAGELSRAAVAAAESEFQMRFVALHAWSGEVACNQRFPFRWGKRWPSEARASRKVALATDLSRAPRERSALEKVLSRPLPELGLVRRDEVTPSTTPALQAKGADVEERRGAGCSVPAPRPSTPTWFLLSAWLGMARRWRRTR
jgi:hypothetical protein